MEQWPQIGLRAAAMEAVALMGIVFARALAKDKSKQVLIWAHSQVILSYGIRFWNEVRVVNNSWKAIVALHSVSGELEKSLRKCCEEAGLEVIQPSAVPWRQWDLCIVTDHCFPDTMLDDRVPILFYFHGLSSAKCHRGANYKYDPRNTHDRFGRLKYDAFIEAGAIQANYAVHANPDLKDVVIVGGDPHIDEFLELDKGRLSLRESLGIEPGEILVLIQSTWGEFSLDSLYGERLYRQCRDLATARGWRFVLSTHPSQWLNGGLAGNQADYFLSLESAHFRILRPEEDRLKWLCAADICVSDATSQSLLFALSGRPLLFVDIPQTALDPRTELAILMSLEPRWDGNEPIEYHFDRLLEASPSEGRKSFLEGFFDFREESSARLSKIVQGLLSCSSLKKCE